MQEVYCSSEDAIPNVARDGIPSPPLPSPKEALMFCLIDCNNFFVSCERLFRPDLRNKPVIVLSNNDGCVIARSNEAKVLGIKMGEPFFAIKGLCHKGRVHVFSSNFPLYRDLSMRVMSIIEDHWSDTEIYSVDEAFLHLKTLAQDKQEAFCAYLQEKIVRDTGIPTTVGIGSTKTLAKLANHIAKKTLKIPLFHMTQTSSWLAQIEVGAVWGIGRHLERKLHALGIMTAEDLSQLQLTQAKKLFSVVVQRTVLELRGVSALSLREKSDKQSILSSSAFGSLQSNFEPLFEAIASHCAKASQKLRAQKSVAQYLSVFIRSNRHRSDLKQHTPWIQVKLIHPTDDVRYLTAIARSLLKKIFKEGVYYQKAGVLLEEIIPKNLKQNDLLDPESLEEVAKSAELMALIDNINKRYGKKTVHLAAEGFTNNWSVKRQRASPRYTTSWSELPLVQA